MESFLAPLTIETSAGSDVEELHMRSSVVILVICLVAVGSANAQVPQVVSTSPGQNELNVAGNTLISVEFDIDMDPSSITISSFLVYGDLSGWHEGVVAYNPTSRVATFDPSTVPIAGERIAVALLMDIHDCHC
jgi:hypothetical protein